MMGASSDDRKLKLAGRALARSFQVQEKTLLPALSLFLTLVVSILKVSRNVVIASGTAEGNVMASGMSGEQH